MINELMDDIFKDLSTYDVPPIQEILRQEYLDALNNDKVYEKAEVLGVEVVIPDSHTVTLDIDSPTLPPHYDAVLGLVQQYYPVVEQWQTTSKSGNLHLYLRFKHEFTEMEKIALQAILGSDPKREALNFARAKEGNLGYPSLMFEVKDKDVQKVPF